MYVTSLAVLHVNDNVLLLANQKFCIAAHFGVRKKQIPVTQQPLVHA